VRLPYASVEELRRAYHFTDLQSFLDLYYAGMAVLRTEADFAELAHAYFARARAQGVVHAEIFFDPQAHTARGVAFETVIDGLWSAVRESEANHGITSKLIMCFLRDQSAASAMTTLEQALRYGERIVAVGLDSAEAGNPPAKFTEVFARARAEGWLTVAHAGEEGPPQYVWDALDLLKVARIDHGVRSLEDPRLVARLRDERIPLTVCPLSNVKLHVVERLRDHPLGAMLDAGLLATVNSDDPAYFGGYAGDNYAQVASALGLGNEALLALARNSFEAAFLTAAERETYLALLEPLARP
jgi:adenosine deaminase